MNTQSIPLILIEDSDEDFEITTGALRLANVRNPIVRCSNGRDAALLLKRDGPYSDLPLPSLVLLDLNLGGADGRQLLKQLRENQWLRPVPVCVLTTSANPADVEYCYREGANAYLVKCIDLDRFEAMIQQFSAFWFDVVALPAAFRSNRYAIR